MKLVNGICALAAVFILAACSTGTMDPVDMLNRAQPVGSPYTKYLAIEYRDLANTVGGESGQYFARKGLAAVDGILVTPEALTAANMTGVDGEELARARADLVTALENGGGDTAPAKAAIAQAAFDCWVTGQEGRWNPEGATCRQRFSDAMGGLKTATANAPPPAMPPAEEFPAPVTDAPHGANVPLNEAAFMVFFDWDKYDLTGSARSVLDTVAKEIKARQDVKQVVVIGHTDTSGGEKYNQALSMKRANAVKAALSSRGMKNIRVEGRGENDLLVKTPDNTREPENRRAQISLE
jgi:OOP family OmpA-OmpF porin